MTIIELSVKSTLMESYDLKQGMHIGPVVLNPKSACARLAWSTHPRRTSYKVGFNLRLLVGGGDRETKMIFFGCMFIKHFLFTKKKRKAKKRKEY